MEADEELFKVLDGMFDDEDESNPNYIFQSR
jgi:hypothetical protein